jgi:plastocyanin
MSSRFPVLLLVGLCFAGCSSDTAPTPTPSPTPAPTPVPGPTASVAIVEGAFNLSTTAFSPSPLNVAVGTTVTWVNNDITLHDSKADNGAFDTGFIAPGASASVTFRTAGSLVYHCSLHPGMVGTVNVQ